MAWTEAQDQDFGATMQRLAMQFAQNKQQFQTYPYPHEEQAARNAAAGQFMQEATNSFKNYQETGNPIHAQEAILYHSAAAATDPKAQPTWQWEEFENIDFKSSKAPSEESIAQCVGNIAAKIVSVILGVKLGLMTAVMVQAAVVVTATILFGPVVGIGANIPAIAASGAAGIKAGMEAEKAINKEIKSTANWLKNSVEETYKAATGKGQSTAKGR
jgi:hypothetical protein